MKLPFELRDMEMTLKKNAKMHRWPLESQSASRGQMDHTNHADSSVPAVPKGPTDLKSQTAMEEQQHTEDLMALSRAATALVELTADVDLYQIIADQLYQLAKDDINIIVNSYDEVSGDSQTQAFAGPPEMKLMLNGIMGRSPVGMALKMRPETIRLLGDGQLHPVPGGAFPINQPNIPQKIAADIENLFNVHTAYIMGFVWQGKLFGSVIILVRTGSKLKNPDLIQTFVRQAAIAMQRKQAWEALAKAKEELEIKVLERTAALTEANASLRMEINIRQQVEEELRKSEAMNVGLLDNAPNPIIVHHPDGSILFANKALILLTGFSAREIIGTKPPFPWWPHGKAAEYLRIFNAERIRGVRHFERLFHKKDGNPLWIELTSTALKNEKGETVSAISIWQDITERKKTEGQITAYQRELRSLASQLTLAESNERRNIATQIHAGVTQLLALCVMRMEVLMDSNRDSKLSKDLDEIYKILQQAIEDTRTLTFELSPPSLYDLGLDAALEELIEQFAQQNNVTASYDDDGKPKPLDESTSVLLFQAIRELLENVTRHSRAHNVEVYSERADDRIHISVKDDGTGMDLRSLKDKHKRDIALGLFGIRERFRYIGGRLQVESTRGKGTRITLIAPLKTKG
jgi:PAS domain S-box-containing protein